MKKQAGNEYYVLVLSQKKVSLLKLQNTDLEEINDGNFPMTFEDNYEYAKSSRGTSFGYALKNYEKDKSFVKKERFAHFLHAVNQKLKTYLQNQTSLLLVGTNEDRNLFKRIFDTDLMISGEIAGSFTSDNLGALKQAIAATRKQ